MSSAEAELRERIARLSEQITSIHMIDRWRQKDRENLSRLESELAHARAQLRLLNGDR